MISRILVATDFSTRSDRALRRATLLARQAKARLTLVHVVDEDQPKSLVQAQEKAAAGRLEETAATIGEYDAVEADARIVTGDAFSGILAAADAVDADLIVLGPHRRQLRDIFVGTTAERTIAHSGRPVLVAAGIPDGPYGRAMVAVDLAKSSRAAIARLQGMQGLGAGEWIAMHAFEAPARSMLRRAMVENAEVEAYISDRRNHAAPRLAAFLAESGLVAARRRLDEREGSAGRSVLDAARAERAGLIVVGASQRRGLERLMVGSVARDVVGEADRDVLVIPAVAASVAAPEQPADAANARPVAAAAA
jgi:nucleotide-binding universal stress UspA family protein